MSYLKDREIWLSNVPTGNPPTGYFWKFIQNGKVVVRDSSGNNQMMVATSGSQAITGSLTVTGGITGTATTASYVEYNNVANKPALVSGSSQITYSGLTGIPSGIVSGSAQIASFGIFATTGSNGFNGSQSITGSLTVTGQVVAQTLNVQQVTSSVVFSSGSNIFGNSLANTQQFTGSLQVSGSSHYVLGNVLIGTTTNSNSRFQVIGPNSNLLPLVDLVASGTGSFQRGVRLLNSGMNSGDHIMYAVGQADNARNMGQVYFQYSGSASTSNRLSFGLHSVDDVLNILGTGNVGVGTVSPSAKLEVEAASNPEISIASTAGATSNLLSFKATSHSQPIQTQLKTIDNGNFTSDLAFLFKASGTGGTLSEKMRITSDGKLHVLGITGLPATSGTTQNGTLRLQVNGYGTVLDFGAEGPSTGKQWIQVTNATNLSITYPLLLNPNGGDVGIGTVSPGNFNTLTFTGPFLDVAGVVQIKGTSANTIAALQFGGDTFRKALIYSSIGTEDPYLAFSVSSSGNSSSSPERMRITSGGDLIFNPNGNTSYFYINQGTGADGGLLFRRNSSNRWQVAPSTPGDNLLFYSYGISNPALTLNYSTGAATFSNSITSSYTYNGGGVGMLHLTSGGTEGGGITFEKTSGTAQKYKMGNSGTAFFVYDETGAKQPFTILNNGNVGIGITSPGAKLHVRGINELSTFFDAQNEGASGATFARVGNSFPYNHFNFANGTVYIGTSSNPLSNATPLLGIVAGAATDAVNIKHTQNGNNTVNIWQTGASSFSALAFYKGDSQGATVGSIVVTTSGTTYNTTSDYRLKTDIVPIENGIDRLMQLKPSKFNWITTGEEAEGFIAHELQEIFPDAVSGEKDAIYSSTGNIKPQSVDYGRITPLLVKAIQEQQTLIESLKSRIEILEQ